VESALNEALTAGYRHIDAAPVYMNEIVIGRVLKEWIDSGKLSRTDLFITTKLPPQGKCLIFFIFVLYATIVSSYRKPS
jgi:alcohol dehydrogenase (NADP+)